MHVSAGVMTDELQGRMRLVEEAAAERIETTIVVLSSLFVQEAAAERIERRRYL